jgi:hypothetical protein
LRWEFYAEGNHSFAVCRLQGQELLHDQEPEDDSGPPGNEEVLPQVPQAHGAQGSEIEGLGIWNLRFVNCKVETRGFTRLHLDQITNYQFSNYQ